MPKLPSQEEQKASVKFKGTVVSLQIQNTLLKLKTNLFGKFICIPTSVKTCFPTPSQCCLRRLTSWWAQCLFDPSKRSLLPTPEKLNFFCFHYFSIVLDFDPLKTILTTLSPLEKMFWPILLPFLALLSCLIFSCYEQLIYRACFL